MTREQMPSFLRAALDLDPVATGLGDVTGTHAGSVGAVVKAGIANGYIDGTFRPGAAVTREEMATFLQAARALLR